MNPEIRHSKLCVNCPRFCASARDGSDYGYCNSSNGFDIASICIHKGEEPVISGDKGICNIFFSHCNLQCIYCQNIQISKNDADRARMSPDEVFRRITDILDQGINSIGFVSPSHMVDQVKAIIAMINGTGRKPVYVWNTSAYDHVKMLRSLEGLIDVYLPDFKYADPGLGKTLSDVEDYPQRAILALKEMYRQKGSSIILGNQETIEFGMIIRHLILPGYIENSKACLGIIAEELSPSVHISLMSQYHPIPEVMDHPQLGRTITTDEYREVVDEFDRLGFYRGWVQEMESESYYNPDFDEVHPFEH